MTARHGSVYKPCDCNRSGRRFGPQRCGDRRERMPPAKPKNGNGKEKAQNGGNLGFEAELFLAADKLRKNLEPSDYKHVVLGLIFLRHISGAFEAKRAALLAEDPQSAEDQDEYLA